MRILIYGAGALGRGFLAPLAQNGGHHFTLCDCNKSLVTALGDVGCYWLVQVIGDGSYLRRIRPNAVLLRGQENPDDYDYIYTAVGNEAVHSLPLERGNVVICENNRECAQEWWKRNHGVGFGVPDVIASGTAPAKILEVDPLAVASEPGELWAEHGPLGTVVPDLDVAWYRKLYLHNIPHAALAFLGQAASHVTIDQSAYIFNAPLSALMTQLVKAGVAVGYFEADDAAAYAKRELARFSHTTLCDPITRVAREPSRKLGRLIEGRVLLRRINEESPFLEEAIEVCEASCSGNGT